MGAKPLILRALTYLVLILALFPILLPIYWMIITAVKPKDEVFTFTPEWVPHTVALSNFGLAWNSAPFGHYFINSVVVTTGIIFLQLVTSTLAAYALARLRFFGRGVLFLIILSAMILPIQITFLANFVTLKNFGWLDTYQGLVIPFAASAFGTFLLRQAFLAVPPALEDAARLDRCTGLSFLWNFLVPLSRPTLLAFTLVALVAHWNDYFWPLIVTNTDAVRTLPIGLGMFIAQEVTTDWNLLMAATLFVSAPLLIAFFVAQRYFISSFMHSGLKG
ncbi:MAG: carbohydrate ABC transporter permease [Chloroflexi bacterium]|nr:carbohydrate ABC transporter permease [Chloroflexota bacterium]MCL5952047.1 carbohydrate ABC transporter permease [Chloroflexota bacterium]